MSHDVIGTMLCFSSVLAHGLSFYQRGFLNFAQNFFSIFPEWDRRPRSIEAEFASSDGNFLPRRARLLSLFWPVR